MLYATNNLPVQPTSFIGRQRETADVKRLVSHTQVVTLIGAGGCGKTRLALQVGAELLKEFPGGVWFVGLASLRDPRLVSMAVASAVGIQGRGRGTVVDDLRLRFRFKPTLLLLDNCERMRSACTELVDLLCRSCGPLRILATSREPLRREGEFLYQVPPLSLPDVLQPVVVERVKLSDAVRLFVERTIAIAPRFEVTNNNAWMVAEICCRLDGIPLAIEMAAARMNMLSEKQILKRLDDRFQFLALGYKRLPQHQTLLATLTWSYDLLSPQEKKLLARLSVFVGGWTLEVAESVCHGSGIEVPEILDLLTALVNKSMVVSEGQCDGGRFRLLESVREYALRQLTPGERAEFCHRHLAWFLRLAEQADRQGRGPEQERWWELFDIERDNLRAALAWAVADAGSADSAMRLAKALTLFWRARGDNLEASRWFQRVIAHPGEVSNAVKAKALADAVHFALEQGQIDLAVALSAEALSLARECGDPKPLALTVLRSGEVALSQGAFEEAKRLFEESLDLFHEHGDDWAGAGVLGALAEVARGQGNLQLELEYLERVLAHSRECGDRRRVGLCLRRLGSFALARRDHREATLRFTESLEIARQFKAWPSIISNFIGLAAAAALQGQWKRAGRLLGVARYQHEGLGYWVLGDRYKDTEALVKRAMGDGAFVTASAEGRAMTLERAIEYALKCVGLDDANGQRRGRHNGPLTGRERQVASLLASGLTNREIASMLATSERTIESHVQHILNKLSLNSRAQVAIWAMQHEARELGTGEAQNQRSIAVTDRMTKN